MYISIYKHTPITLANTMDTISNGITLYIVATQWYTQIFTTSDTPITLGNTMNIIMTILLRNLLHIILTRRSSTLLSTSQYMVCVKYIFFHSWDRFLVTLFLVVGICLYYGDIDYVLLKVSLLLRIFYSYTYFLY